MTQRAFRRWTMVAAAVAAAAAGPWLGGCTPSPATGEMQFILIGDRQEIALGAEAAPQIEEQLGGLVEDSRLQEYVSAVGTRVAAHAERDMPYEFGLVASDVPNAFALPGGKIYVSAGLMSRMTNERQLAAVLGHEIGHITDRHNVQQLQRQMGTLVLADLAGTVIGGERAEAVRAGVQIAGGMLNLRYSRENEYMADRLGIRYMATAGYNPWGMVELLQLLQALSGAEGPIWGEMLSTHPLTSRRIAEAAAMVRELHPEADPDAPDPRIDAFIRMRERLKALPKPDKDD